MINIMICDNDVDCLKNTENFLSEYISRSNYGEIPVTVRSSSSPLEVISISEEFPPDILILDIHMPEKNGLEIAEAFHNKKLETKIIFLTNYEQFVFYSLRFSPFRFIRKEKMESELPEAIDSAIRYFSSCTESLVVNKYSDYEVIPLGCIKYIEKIKLKNRVNIVCTDKSVEYGNTIQYLENKLNGSGFTKI
ncbi:MAG: response regulator, partial [Roseburia sp.]|nr:response regulator [Roseburia sp.]